MNLRVGARTDVGRVREANEDGYMIHEPLFAVADGMGGHQGGEVASRLALQALEEIARSGDSEAASRLAEVVREANRDVLREASKDAQLAGMGTTLTAAIALPEKFHLVHVGDSRAYLFRDGELRQLTVDHTVVQRLVDEGRITPEEAEIHPQRSILTRALGVDQEVTVDESIVDIRDGDRLLLCSDGLTGMVTEDDIVRILGDEADAQAAADALVDAANAAGGQDNVTALVIDVVGQNGSASRTATRAARPRGGTAATAEHRQVGPAVWAETERRPVWRTVLWVLVPLLLIGAALAGGKWWVDRQWFVGVSNDRVAMYRGIPARPLGIDLSTLVKETDISADDARRFPHYSALDEGITADGEEDAFAIVEEIRQTVRDAEREERDQQQGEQGGGE